MVGFNGIQWGSVLFFRHSCLVFGLTSKSACTPVLPEVVSAGRKTGQQKTSTLANHADIRAAMEGLQCPWRRGAFKLQGPTICLIVLH